MKCLVPVITQSGPSRTARVRIPRRSEPASGSVMARHSVRSPATVGSRWLSRWASLQANRIRDGRATAYICSA